MNLKIQGIREKLKSSRAVVALTGAGVSAESGVPTFRGKDGLWRNFRAEELATPEAFARDPKLVWEWYDWRRSLIAALKPNPAHLALVELEKRLKNFTLITQNVDGLHRKAGSRNLLELHGNIWKVQCTGCHKTDENFDVPIKLLPYCQGCGGLLRPGVVWFGEELPEAVLLSAIDAVGSCDLMLVIGTSAIVQPAASLGLMARRKGAFVVEVNLEPTPISNQVDESILGKAGEVLPQFL